MDRRPWSAVYWRCATCTSRGVLVTRLDDPLRADALRQAHGTAAPTCTSPDVRRVRETRDRIDSLYRPGNFDA